MNPEQRFSINTVLERLGAVAEFSNFNLRTPLDIQVKPKEPELEMPHQNDNGEIRNPPVRPPRPSPNHPPPPKPPQRPPESKGQSGLFSSLKGGAGSFLKNLKDTSSKVMQSVQQ